MNREETKKAIAVMQAYVDGEEIRLDTIRGLINPTWNWESYHYEVVIKPQEFWIVYAPHIGTYVYRDEKDAAKHCRNYVGAKVVHVREVEK